MRLGYKKNYDLDLKRVYWSEPSFIYLNGIDYRSFWILSGIADMFDHSPPVHVLDKPFLLKNARGFSKNGKKAGVLLFKEEELPS